MYFQPDDLQKLKVDYSQIDKKHYDILLAYRDFQPSNSHAFEYKNHGFLRRLSTLKRCIHNVYAICPPEKCEKPSDDELIDLRINLQSFIFNIFGCIDNLVWLWVKENQFQCSKDKVSFLNKNIQNNFSTSFKNYLNSEKFQKWLKYLTSFRHALAHRIPLYVPPSNFTPVEKEKFQDLENQKLEIMKKATSLTEQNHNEDHLSISETMEILEKQEREFEKVEQLSFEQEQLGEFYPEMLHSFQENSPRVIFHAQLLADWNSILELSHLFLNEFN